MFSIVGTVPSSNVVSLPYASCTYIFVTYDSTFTSTVACVTYVISSVSPSGIYPMNLCNSFLFSSSTLYKPALSDAVNVILPSLLYASVITGPSVSTANCTTVVVPSS